MELVLQYTPWAAAAAVVFALLYLFLDFRFRGMVVAIGIAAGFTVLISLVASFVTAGPWINTLVFSGTGVLTFLTLEVFQEVTSISRMHELAGKTTAVFAVVFVVVVALIASEGSESRTLAVSTGSSEPTASVFDDEEDIGFQLMAEVDPENCDTGDLRDLHGEDGYVLNGGAETLGDMVAAARDDPWYVRQLYNDLRAAYIAYEEGVDPVSVRARLDAQLPPEEVFRCVEARQELHARIVGMLDISQTDVARVGDVASALRIPVAGDTALILNQVVVGNGVEYHGEAVSVNEMLIVTTLPNGAKVAKRTVCANEVVPPKEEPTPTPTPTNPSTPTATPTVPSETPTTPTATPTVPKKKTPQSTYTPPPPCCPDAEETPPAEGGTPVAPTFTPRPTRAPLPQPTPDQGDPSPNHTPVPQ